MNVLITAGGTKEDIDPVRGITNYASGRLGCMIADKFIRAGCTVTYICGETAAHPEGLHTTIIRNTAQLQEKMEAALRSEKFDCVIHSMAVSDYAPVPQKSKLSSDAPYRILFLKRQPKVINCIKEIQPDTLLVGFKLLSNASEDDLIQASRKQMESAKSDLVLANVLEDIQGDVHKAILIGKDSIIARGKTKREIAEMIYENCNSWHNR